MTCSPTYRSPRLPSGRGTPLPRNRKTLPVLAPLGTVMVTGPVGVDTSTLPPSTASAREIGSTSRMSSPSRLNRRWGRTSSSTYASPGWAAAEPRSTLAAQAQDLTVARAWWDGDVQGTAVRQGDPLGRPVHGLEEVDRQAVVHVRAAHPDIRPPAPAEQLGKGVVCTHQILETGAGGIGVVRAGGEVAIEPLGWSLGTGRIDLAPVEAGPLLGVAHKIVGGGNALELLLGFRIAGIEIGMELLRLAAVSLLDLLGRGARRHPEHVIRIVTQRAPSALPSLPPSLPVDDRNEHAGRQNAPADQGSKTVGDIRFVSPSLRHGRLAQTKVVHHRSPSSPGSHPRHSQGRARAAR